MQFPREIFNPQGAHKVVFGPEEYAAAKAEGWVDQPPTSYFLPSNEEAKQEVGLSAGELMLRGMANEVEQRKRRGRPPKVQSIGEVA